jgi:hypothetical protein
MIRTDFINDYTNCKYQIAYDTTCQRFDLYLCYIIGRLTYKQLICNE